MGKIHALAEFPETRCPACGTVINTSSAARKRKVQCPKCREIVELGKPEPVPAPSVVPDASAVRIAELEARLSRMEALEARIAALENALKPSAIVPFPEPQPAPPEPARKLRWTATSDAHRAVVLPAELQETLLFNLRTFPARSITLRAALADPEARPRAEQLKIIFERAHWTVRGPDDVPARRSDHGLSLAVGSLPLPTEATAIFLALTASGFGLDSLLDPNLGGGEAVLIVG